MVELRTMKAIPKYGTMICAKHNRDMLRNLIEKPEGVGRTEMRLALIALSWLDVAEMMNPVVEAAKDLLDAEGWTKVRVPIDVSERITRLRASIDLMGHQMFGLRRLDEEEVKRLKKLVGDALDDCDHEGGDEVDEAFDSLMYEYATLRQWYEAKGTDMEEKQNARTT
jgi:hypothetical protein